MAQDDPRGIEAAAGQGGTKGSSGTREAAGTAGARTASESSGAYGSTRTSPPESGTPVASGSEHRVQGGQGSRLSRREGWDDPLTSFFGGSPFALFRRLSDDMDRLFFGSGGGQGLGAFGNFGGRFLPHIEIDEREDRLLIHADLPGCRPEDFHVDVEDDALVLQGERRSQNEENRGGIRRSERSYGSFRRVIPLPQGANVEAANARFENGVLEIDIPLQQQSRSRRLEVQSGSGKPGSSGSTGGDPTRH